ncbi:GDSL-type esterase/lipase family protein [Galbibacter sp. EGI 63066]|uniref:SGNH/GDSL hydrolase family protein n=1 Tax=Galbibacter sp. EGI 63066 TaxID=2993559 RepID=UPI002249077A|nr:SGNH/GDSL hydrolase family protein [Galbibacter sp. EGI 63066]MCX2678598.1 GDSL-type esterase/lipase family protein [Galbibacter sp. EGI 63066]
MKRIIIPCLCVLFIGCKEIPRELTVYNDVESELFHYQGRTEPADNGRKLISSAASVTFMAEGDSVHIYTKALQNEYGFIEITVNDTYLKRYKINSGEENKISIALDAPQSKVEVFKATEAVNGGILFTGIEAEKLVPFEDDRSLVMEFIGDSITCGYGADTNSIPCDTGEWYDQHTAYWAYGSRIARASNAKYTLSSVSGMGMYRNWNDEDQMVMPDVYQTTELDGDTTHLWNFPVTPQIVSICLGTNDLSDGDGEKERKPFDKEKFIENYTTFVEGIYERYPKVKVVLLNSPMVSGEKGELLMECLESVQAHFEAEKPIFIFKFEGITPQGCDYHPDINDHKKMAEMVISDFKTLL